jgi:hypothetical protein
MSSGKSGGYNDYNRFFRIYRLEEDWCTPPEYIPLIYHALGSIDLDPASTAHANAEFLKAENFYTKEDDAINVEEPWRGNVYCFPPTYGRCSFNRQRGTWRWSSRGGFTSQNVSKVWFNRLEREWKLGFINSALFYSISPEMMRIAPTMWDYPICIPRDRPRLVHGKTFKQFDKFPKWGFFIYLPPRGLGLRQTEQFEEAFSTIGKIVL